MSYLALFRAEAHRDKYEAQQDELDAVRRWRDRHPASRRISAQETAG